MGLLTSIFRGTNKAELEKRIKEGAFLVDVRTPGEFASGSVKGAVNIPLDLLAKNIIKFKGKGHIVVFCRSGMRSGQAKTMLEKNGFVNVTNGGSWTDVFKLVN